MLSEYLNYELCRASSVISKVDKKKTLILKTTMLGRQPCIFHTKQHKNVYYHFRNC